MLNPTSNFSENDQIPYIPKDYNANNQSIVHVEVPSLITTLRESAFSNCSKMETITLPKKLNVIVSGSCFKDCSNLNMIEIPNSVHFIGSAAFANCTNLRHIDLSENFRSIPYKMFF